jgi:hypothetical protein
VTIDELEARVMTLAAALADVAHELEELCMKYDAIGGGHAAQPLRVIATKARAALEPPK